MDLDENNINVQLGKRLEELINERGYSISAFAEATGSSPAYLSKVIRGEANLKFQQIEKYCDGLQITVECFLYPLVESGADSFSLRMLSITKEFNKFQKGRALGYLECLSLDTLDVE